MILLEGFNFFCFYGATLGLKEKLGQIWFEFNLSFIEVVVAVMDFCRRRLR
jgi:hypothetical protein